MRYLSRTVIVKMTSPLEELKQYVRGLIPEEVPLNSLEDVVMTLDDIMQANPKILRRDIDLLMSYHEKLNAVCEQVGLLSLAHLFEFEADVVDRWSAYCMKEGRIGRLIRLGLCIFWQTPLEVSEDWANP